MSVNDERWSVVVAAVQVHRDAECIVAGRAQRCVQAPANFSASRRSCFGSPATLAPGRPRPIASYCIDPYDKAHILLITSLVVAFHSILVVS